MNSLKGLGFLTIAIASTCKHIPECLLLVEPDNYGRKNIYPKISVPIGEQIAPLKKFYIKHELNSFFLLNSKTKSGFEFYGWRLK